MKKILAILAGLSLAACGDKSTPPVPASQEKPAASLPLATSKPSPAPDAQKTPQPSGAEKVAKTTSKTKKSMKVAKHRRTPVGDHRPAGFKKPVETVPPNSTYAARNS